MVQMLTLASSDPNSGLPWAVFLSSRQDRPDNPGILVGQRDRYDIRVPAVAHLAEHGLVAATGTAQLKRLADAIEDSDTALPEGVRNLGQMYLAQIAGLNTRVSELDQKMRCAAKEADLARRAQTMPGVGPITALAIETFAPDLATFRRGRDFAAWLGLVPKQHSTGGNPTAELLG